MPAFIVVGLGYGDEGKGITVDHLVRQHQASGVVRFNGGAQAAHNVVLPDGRHHTFSQFGAGFFAGAMTYLSKYMLVNPHVLFSEGLHLAELGFKPWDRIAVQADALVTTPFHVAANRLREYARGQNRHGSCGMGIGETVQDAQIGREIRVRDLRDPKLVYEKLHDMQIHKRKQMMPLIYDLPGGPTHDLAHPFFDFSPIKEAMDVYRVFNKIIPVFEEFDFDPDETYVFEGAQGVLLDEWCGFHPHTTWSDTTPRNAARLLVGEMDEDDCTVIGVMRSYMTRHGAGPFVTEAPELAERFPEAHNDSEGFQGAWRVGWTDLRAISYALNCIGGVDALSVTHLDRVSGDWKICLDYPLTVPSREMTHELWEFERALTLNDLDIADKEYAEFEQMDPITLVEIVEARLDTPVTIQGYGPTHLDVRSSERIPSGV